MKSAGILIVTVVVGLLGVYGGYVASNVYGRIAAVEQAPAAAPTLDCAAENAAAEERRDALRSDLRSLESALEERYLAAGDGPRSLPPGYLPEGSIQTLARTLFAFDLELIHCREYPCVLVVRSAPSAEIIEQLEIAQFTPRIVGDGPRWGVVLEMDGYPAPERTKPRVQALLR